jgi:predicted O-methyltransferase YrrM
MTVSPLPDRAGAPRRGMPATRVHRLAREQRVGRPLVEVFAFFAEARNLERITPAWLSFNLRSSGQGEIRRGTLLEYSLRVHGITLLWLRRDASERPRPGECMVRTVQDAFELVKTIPGWLLPEDAAKLYELAQCSAGPILEIGTYRGKSAILMALAIRNAGRDGTVYTLDVDPHLIADAAAEADRWGIADKIVFVRGTLNAYARAYPRLRPALTFVDGDHSHAGVQRDLTALQALIPKGGLLLFHDFNDPRNDDPHCSEVNVRSAIEASWVANQCQFRGAFGACGMFERTVAPNQPTVTIVDLLRLDTAREQCVHRLRRPVARLWQKLRSAET